MNRILLGVFTLLTSTAFANQTFSDADLDKELQSHSWGVIYVWSPHMPLSIQGLKTVKDAVKKKDGAVIYLVDGEATQQEINEVLAVNPVAIKESRMVASRKIDSLLPSLHYPTAYYFKNQMISPSHLRGFKEVAGYDKWLSLEERRAESKR
jgi:hypothetical protein